MTEASAPFARYVAVGDSFTEGVGDEDPLLPGGVRGWADRVAEVLATQNPAFTYANLAIRGKLIAPIVAGQVEHAVALQPDLITFCAGGNDILRPGTDPDDIAAQFDRALARLASTGARLVVFTGIDVGSRPVFGLIRGKVAIYNENIRVSAARYGATVVDQWGMTFLQDPRMWAPDRLHFSALGHHNMAIQVLSALGIPNQLHPEQPEPTPEHGWLPTTEDLHWARDYLWPWVVRRVRGASSGDGRHAKRPHPTPVHPDGAPSR
ncbi:MAG: SGNH/GDSL hydrolase family protein [Microbacteriaceae bacterium]|nr:SGNH/GDSL hydrolase family protein [Microbacteriaceae bacterium]